MIKKLLQAQIQAAINQTNNEWSQPAIEDIPVQTSIPAGHRAVPPQTESIGNINSITNDNANLRAGVPKQRKPPLTEEYIKNMGITQGSVQNLIAKWTGKLESKYDADTNETTQPSLAENRDKEIESSNENELDSSYKQGNQGYVKKVQAYYHKLEEAPSSKQFHNDSSSGTNSNNQVKHDALTATLQNAIPLDPGTPTVETMTDDLESAFPNADKSHLTNRAAQIEQIDIPLDLSLKSLDGEKVSSSEQSSSEAEKVVKNSSDKLSPNADSNNEVKHDAPTTTPPQDEILLDSDTTTVETRANLESAFPNADELHLTNRIDQTAQTDISLAQEMPQMLSTEVDNLEQITNELPNNSPLKGSMHEIINSLRQTKIEQLSFDAQLQIATILESVNQFLEQFQHSPEQLKKIQPNITDLQNVINSNQVPAQNDLFIDEQQPPDQLSKKLTETQKNNRRTEIANELDELIAVLNTIDISTPKGIEIVGKLIIKHLPENEQSPFIEILRANAELNRLTLENAPDEKITAARTKLYACVKDFEDTALQDAQKLDSQESAQLETNALDDANANSDMENDSTEETDLSVPPDQVNADASIPQNTNVRGSKPKSWLDKIREAVRKALAKPGHAYDCTHVKNEFLNQEPILHNVLQRTESCKDDFFDNLLKWIDDQHLELNMKAAN